MVFTFDILRFAEEVVGASDDNPEKYMVTDVWGDKRDIRDALLIVTESQVGTEGEEMISKLREYFGEDMKVILQKMSPTTTAIVGLGSIAIAFKVHRKLN